MFSKFLQFVMVAVSLSPVFLTLSFLSFFGKETNLIIGISYLIIAIAMIGISYYLVILAKSKLEIIPIKIKSVTPADKEVLSFIFVYLLPLISIDTKTLIFILVLFFFIAYATHIYHFNPMLGLFGFHFYEIEIEDGAKFILMTKKSLFNIKQIKKVVQASDYILIEKEE